MRCLACNVSLSDYECSRKAYGSEAYVDLCNRCYSTIRKELPAYGNAFLFSEGDDYEEALFDKTWQGLDKGSSFWYTSLYRDYVDEEDD